MSIVTTDLVDRSRNSGLILDGDLKIIVARKQKTGLEERNSWLGGVRLRVQLVTRSKSKLRSRVECGDLSMPFSPDRIERASCRLWIIDRGYEPQYDDDIVLADEWSEVVMKTKH